MIFLIVRIDKMGNGESAIKEEDDDGHNGEQRFRLRSLLIR